MNRSSRTLGSLGTTLASALLSACTIFILFSARQTDADLPVPRGHGAISHDVLIDGVLAKEGTGWLIRVTAHNPGDRARHCRIDAKLMRIENNVMSRVIAVPQAIWNTSVALNVSSKGDSDQKLTVPTDIARRVREPQEPKKGGNIPLVRESFSVRLEADCSDSNHLI